MIFVCLLLLFCGGGGELRHQGESRGGSCVMGGGFTCGIPGDRPQKFLVLQWIWTLHQ